jgi:spermidine synthase
MRRREQWLLGGCFFLSGCASLVLEVAWSKDLSYILGNTLYAISTVVAAFMGGLCIGSAWIGRNGHRLRRPLRAYALMEAGIGIGAVLSIPIFRATPPLFRVLYNTFDPGQGLFLFLRFGVVLALMLIPVSLMGMTLPVMIGAFGRAKDSYDREAGLLYGVNTIGAVTGTLLAGFLLIPSIGILRSCVFAGGIDLLIALAALLLDRRVGPIAERGARSAAAAARGPRVLSTSPAPATSPAPSISPAVDPRWNRSQWTIGILFGVSGFIALIYEVGWFRLLGLTMGPSVYAFTVMLAVYLIGIGIGSATAAPWVERTRVRAMTSMAILEALLGCIGLLLLFVANRLPEIHAQIFRAAVPRLGSFAPYMSQLAAAAILVFLPCLILGILFPVIVRAVREGGAGHLPEATVGRLYLLNTAGGIAGSLLAGFILLPTLGAWTTLIVAGVASVGIGAAAGILAFADRPRFRFGFAGALLAAAILLVAIAPGWNTTLFNQGLYREVYLGGEKRKDSGRAGQLIYHREGINTAVAVFRSFGIVTLNVGGKADASTNRGDIMPQLLLGHLPILFAAEARKVAVIGYGSGMTAAAVLAHPEVERVDVMEIEKAVIDASVFFETINGNPFDDPRTRLIVEDGRIRLSYTNETYDVISSEPSNPWMAGVSNLFTVDFYKTAARRLRPSGVFAQWIQNYDISEDTFRTILASMGEAFPHLAVFHPSPWDVIVLASSQPIMAPWGDFRARFEEPSVLESLVRADIRDPLEIGFFLTAGEGPTLDAAARAPARNTDDNVWLEHRMPREMVRATVTPSSRVDVGLRLFEAAATSRLEAIRTMIPGIPLADLVRAMILFPNRTEPIPKELKSLSDPWEPFRPIQLAAIEEELERRGDRPLARDAAQWDRQGNAYRLGRAHATEALVASARGSQLPSTQVVERALAEAPDLPMALSFAAGLRAVQGDMAGAEGFYRRILDFPSSSACYDALMGLAQLAFERDDVEEAERWAEAARDRNPYFANAFVLLAHLRLVRGDEQGARGILLEGLRFNPHNSQIEGLIRGE